MEYMLLIYDYLHGFIIISLFILPLSIVFRNTINLLNRIILWVSPLVIYFLLTVVIIPRFFSNVVIFTSVEIYSFLTLLITIIWYVFINKKIPYFIEAVLIIHIEGLISVWFMNQISLLLLQNYALIKEYIILFLTLGIQLFLSIMNIKLIKFCYRRKIIVLFRIFLFFLITGIYFTQLIYPIFFANESTEIIYDGSGNTAISTDALFLFVKVLFAFLTIFFIITVIVIRYHLLSRRLKEKIQKEQEQENYITTLEVLQTDIRKIHHDYKNLITALGGYLYDNDDNVDIKGLKTYYMENIIVQKDVELKTINLSKLQKLKIPEIKGLLAAKLIQASQQSIKVVIEVQDIIEHIPIDIVDLTRVIGNLLDNAIEATMECQNPEIRIAFICNQNIIVIIVENSTISTVLPGMQIFETGFSTKGKGRGLGLSNILDILRQYPYVFQETKLENGYFQQKIVFQEEHT